MECLYETGAALCFERILSGGFRAENCGATVGKTRDIAEQGDNHSQRPGRAIYQHQDHHYGEGQPAAAVHVQMGLLLGQRALGELLRAYEG